MSAPELDHIAIAAWKLTDALPAYEKLGFKLAHTQDVPSEGVRTAFLELAGGAHIELLEPLGEASPLRGFLDKRGPGLHHLAFKTGSAAARRSELAAQGFTPLSAAPKPGSRGTQVCFFHPKSAGGVLVELVEHPKKEASR